MIWNIIKKAITATQSVVSKIDATKVSMYADRLETSAAKIAVKTKTHIQTELSKFRK